MPSGKRVLLRVMSEKVGFGAGSVHSVPSVFVGEVLVIVLVGPVELEFVEVCVCVLIDLAEELKAVPLDNVEEVGVDELKEAEVLVKREEDVDMLAAAVGYTIVVVFVTPTIGSEV